MKYFFDTEFHEYHKQPKMGFFEIGKPIPTIDLISIGIVCEDGREYYAISKDFDIADAWNSYQESVAEVTELVSSNGNEVIQFKFESSDIIKWKLLYKGFKTNYVKDDVLKTYWLRKNVLESIEMDLFKLHCKANVGHKGIEGRGNYKAFKWMLDTYGKTNKQIAKEIKEFVLYKDPIKDIEFYAYYADYDWVVFAQLFGKMIDLPKGFPFYCRDLNQTLDEKAAIENDRHQVNTIRDLYFGTTSNDMIKFWKNHHPKYPKQTNEHNALDDARWNFELYKFLKYTIMEEEIFNYPPDNVAFKSTNEKDFEKMINSGLKTIDKADRFNEGKPKWSLVHFQSMVPMIRVLEFGARKYAPFNWQKPMDLMEILESMQRHLAALFDGEVYDKESGISHMGHIQANSMFYNYHKAKENEVQGEI